MSNEIEMTHAVIDLETMGVNRNAPVIEIGVTLCNPVAGVLGNTAGWRIPLQESLDMGFTADASTVEWWLQQSSAAQDRFNFTKHRHDDDVCDIASALHRVAGFLGSNGPDLLIVGNGPTFDLDLLRNMFDRTGKHTRLWVPIVPWQYWQERDLRSYLEMAAMMGFDKQSIPFDGIKHSGRDDSRHEAKQLIAAMQWVKEYRYHD